MPDPSASSGSPRPFDDAQGRPERVEGRAESSGDWKAHIRPRLASLRLSPSREAEIAEELAQHLDDRWRELMARGVTPEDAAHTARTEFDGARLEALLGTLRQAHWHEPPPPGPTRAFSLDSILIDLRHALRALRATPSFTIGALLVLALGTGATTAIFSVVDAVALRPLPFPEPDRIVAVGVRVQAPVGGAGGPQRAGPAPLGRGGMPGGKLPEPDALASITAQEYVDWADRQQVFEAMAALGGIGDYVFQLPGAEPELVKGDRVTASFFDVLRVRPMLGPDSIPCPSGRQLPTPAAGGPRGSAAGPSACRLGTDAR